MYLYTRTNKGGTMQGKVLVKEGVIEEFLMRNNKNRNWLAREAEIDSSYITLLLNRDRSPSPRIRENLMSALEITDWDALFEVINDIDESSQPMPL
jgi:hypothetical protein